MSAGYDSCVSSWYWVSRGFWTSVRQQEVIVGSVSSGHSGLCLDLLYSTYLWAPPVCSSGLPAPPPLASTDAAGVQEPWRPCRRSSSGSEAGCLGCRRVPAGWPERYSGHIWDLTEKQTPTLASLFFTLFSIFCLRLFQPFTIIFLLIFYPFSKL